MYNLIYLDNAATTRVCKAAADAAYGVMVEDFGNPMSTHFMGRNAADILEISRRRISAALGASPSEICLVSGGTEADNLAICGSVGSKSRPGNHIITSTAEHYAVLKTAEALEKRGFEITCLKPRSDGVIEPEELAKALRDDTALVSLMLVNNETGALNPVAEYAAEIKRRGLRALLHTDAVQGFGKLPFTVKSLGADMISISAHKIHGVKGAGALYIRNGVRLSPIIYGGAQEGGIRSGTHALPAIAAFGVAAELADKSVRFNLEYITGIRDYAVKKLHEIDVRILSPAEASPYILSISLPGYRSETLMNALEQDGICVARSSACKKGARSHVLDAMGLAPAVIDGALRISFSHETTFEEINELIECLKKNIKTLFRRK